MFLNKKSLVFLFFLNLALLGFCQNPSVQNLKLNFERIELEKSNPAYLTPLKGSLYFQQFPYVFVFKLETPEAQISFQNSEGSFFEENDIFYDFSEGDEYLAQTCGDFLNWFKSDFGIPESGYKIHSIEKQGNEVCVLLHYIKEEESPIASVKMYKGEGGVYTKLSMLDVENNLVAETLLSEYKTSGSFKYPGKIETCTYSQNEQVSQVVLTLSNVSVNCREDTLYESEYFYDFQGLPYEQHEHKIYAGTPLQDNYKVSSSAILVNVAFDFYKRFITDQDIPGCAFTPSCSAYMTQTVTAHGIFGIIDGLDRLSRCTRSEVKRNIYVHSKNGLIVEEVSK